VVDAGKGKERGARKPLPLKQVPIQREEYNSSDCRELRGGNLKTIPN